MEIQIQNLQKKMKEMEKENISLKDLEMKYADLKWENELLVKRLELK